jgi:hypothetical protein
MEVAKPLPVFAIQDPRMQSTRPNKNLPAFPRPLDGFFKTPAQEATTGFETVDEGLADHCPRLLDPSTTVGEIRRRVTELSTA